MNIEIKITCSSELVTFLKKLLHNSEYEPTCQNIIQDDSGLKIMVQSSSNAFNHVLKNVENAVEIMQSQYPEEEIGFVVRNCQNSENPLDNQPFEAAPGIIIQPWQTASTPLDQPDVIFLGANDAFGVGTHPTTRLCLNFLVSLAEKQTTGFGKNMVLDIGCGSGILALAAVKLGAKHVIGIEIDSNSAQYAQQNVEWNEMQSQISILHGTLDNTHEQFDLILANLVIGILLPMIDEIACHIKPGGLAILSGVNEGQLQNVGEACLRIGLKTLDTTIETGWGALLLKKPVL